MLRRISGMCCGLAVVFGLAGVCVAAEPVQADEAAAVKLKEEVVLAQPVIEGNQVTRYGGTKTIIGAEQINDLNAQDVTIALRTTPGVTISRYNPIGSFGGGEGGAVFIRGMGSGRPGGEIKTTMDGVNLGNPIYNHGLMDLMPIDPAGRIEVIKGVQPTEQGSGFGGINIVPKTMTEDGFKTKVGTSYGSFNTITETMEHGGKQGAWDYYLGQGYRYSSGHRIDADGSLKDYFGTAGYQLNSAWKLSAFGLHSDNFANDPGASGSDARDGQYKTTNSLGTLTLSNQFQAASGEMKIYWSNVRARWVDKKSTTDDDQTMKGDTYGMKAKEAFRLWAGGEVLTGLDIERVNATSDSTLDSGAAGTSYANQYSTVSPRLAVSHTFGDKSGFYLTPSTGARYFYNSLFGNEWAPHAGIVAGYKDTEVHFSIARGVNYPGLEVFALGGTKQSDLKAELMDHLELGVSHSFTPTLKADLTGFQDHGSNRYERVTGAPTAAWINTGHYETQGVEATVNWEPVKTLSLYAGGTWLGSRPVDLPYAPEWTWTAGSNWLFLDAFKLSTDLQYVDSMHVLTRSRYIPGMINNQTVGGYFLVNAKLAWLFDAKTMGAKSGEIYLAGENLTDAKYATRPEYSMPGIGFTLGANLTF